jgi:flagellar basal body-associated protein FliL
LGDSAREGRIEMKNKGMTLIEVLIMIVILMVITGALFWSCLNNRGATEARAKDGAKTFIAENGLYVERFSCAGDSDGDGYGTCNLALKSGEKVMLNCPTGFVDTKIWGATGCKEIYQNLNHQGGVPVQPSGQ